MAVSHPSYHSVETIKDYNFLKRVKLVTDEESVDYVKEPKIASLGVAEERVKEEIEKIGIDGLTVFKPLKCKAARGEKDLFKLMYAQCTNSRQRIEVDLVGVRKGNPLEPYFVVEVEGFNLKDGGTLHAEVHKDLFRILEKEYDWKLKSNDYNIEQRLAAAVVQVERHARMIYNRILLLRDKKKQEISAFVCFMDTSREKRHIYLYLRFIFENGAKDVYATPIRNWANVQDKMKSLTDNNRPALPQEWKVNGFGKDSCAFIASPKKDYVYKVMRCTVTAYIRSYRIKRFLVKCAKYGSSRGIEDAIKRLEGREDEIVTVYDLMNEYFDDKLIESLFHRGPESIKSMKPILSTRFHDRWRNISGLVIYQIPFHVSLAYKLRSLDEGMKLETAITVDSARPALADICLSYLLAGEDYPEVDVRPANLRLVGEVFRFMDWGETWGSGCFRYKIIDKDSPLNLILRSEMRSTSFKNNLLDNYKELQIKGGEFIVDQLIEEIESLCKSQCTTEVMESIEDEIVKLGEDLIDEIREIIVLIDIDEYFKV